MIKSISIRNFKCFESLDLAFGELNVLSGTNGSGKSTLIQSLLLVWQSIRARSIYQRKIELNGDLVDIGTTRDALFRRSESDSISITFDFGGASGDPPVSFVAETSVGAQERVVFLASFPPIRSLRHFRRQFFYLSADRLGPRKMYPFRAIERRDSIGVRGEYAALIFHRERERKLRPSSLLLPTSDGNTHPILRVQVEAWMRRFFPGFDMRTELLESVDSVTVGIGLQEQTGEPDLFRPSNVGYGISVVFPIILAGLLCKKGGILIVENPEAHLHPSAQSLIGEFLARVVSTGAQVLVETHSDHVINGIRLAVKNSIVDSQKTKFLAFSRGAAYGTHEVRDVPISETGVFGDSPDMFFDQAEKDLKLLYGY